MYCICFYLKCISVEHMLHCNKHHRFLYWMVWLNLPMSSNHNKTQAIYFIYFFVIKIINPQNVWVFFATYLTEQNITKCKFSQQLRWHSYYYRSVCYEKRGMGRIVFIKEIKIKLFRQRVWKKGIKKITIVHCFRQHCMGYDIFWSLGITLYRHNSLCVYWVTSSETGKNLDKLCSDRVNA